MTGAYLEFEHFPFKLIVIQVLMMNILKTAGCLTLPIFRNLRLNNSRI